MQIFADTRNTRTITAWGKTHVRSDVPTAVSEAEVVWLLEHGIHTVIDLRTEGERAHKPCPLQADPRFVYHVCPITGGDRVPCCPDEVAGSYIAMVDARFLRCFHSFATPPAACSTFATPARIGRAL